MFRKQRPITRILTLCCFITLFIPVKLIQFISISIISIIGISFLYSKTLQKNIKVERRIHKLKIACREKVETSVVVKNYSKLPALICYIFDDAPYLLVYNNKNCDVVTLRPGEIKNFTYTFSAQQRGLFHAGPVKIRTSDPLGLFSFEQEIEDILDITVRPSRIKLITLPSPGLPQGNLKINNPIFEDVSERRTIRKYINGDEQRRINWQITAKQGDLYTNVFENSYETSFFVFLNLAEDEYELHSLYYDTEKAIEIAACIVEKARELRQRVGFAAYGTDFPYLKPAINQYDLILDLLSIIKTEKGKLNYDPYKFYKPQLPNGVIFFTVGPEEVRNYFSKVEANHEEITSENIGAHRRNTIGA